MGNALVPRTCGGAQRPTLHERRWSNHPTPIVTPAPHSARARRVRDQQAPTWRLRRDECTPLQDDLLLSPRSCGIARIVMAMWVVPLAGVDAAVEAQCQMDVDMGSVRHAQDGACVVQNQKNREIVARVS